MQWERRREKMQAVQLHKAIVWFFDSRNAREHRALARAGSAKQSNRAACFEFKRDVHLEVAALFDDVGLKHPDFSAPAHALAMAVAEPRPERQQAAASQPAIQNFAGSPTIAPACRKDSTRSRRLRRIRQWRAPRRC